MLGMGQPAGDAFAMIFQQLMGGEEMEGDLAALLMQLAGNLQDDSEEMGSLLSAEMLAMMPDLAPQDLFAMMQNDTTLMTGAINVLAASLNSPQGRAQLPMILAQAEKTGNEDLQELLEGDLPQADKDFLQVLESAWKEEPQPTLPVTGMDQSAIRAAKELLAKNRKDQNTETIDVESLQADVNSRRFLSSDAVGQKQQLPVPDAQEIAKQIRLRNLSGIIVVDFINMEKAEDMQLLLREFRKALSLDPIQTTLVDVTALQLVEVTRKKLRKPLHECCGSNNLP